MPSTNNGNALQVRRFILLLAPLLVSLMACGPEVVYHERKVVSANGWDYGSQLCFPFEVKDTSSLYGLELEVVTTEDYKYQNAYVRVHTTFPHQPVSQQVLSLELRDASGVPKGKCSGARCVTRIPLQEQTYFSAPGAYSLCFEQHMRDTVVMGVESLELRLVKKKAGDE